jgi:hypothetical protein
MAASGKVGSNTGEFVACAGLKFPPPSTSMVAQRFPKEDIGGGCKIGVKG